MKREEDCSSSSCVKNVTVSDALSGQIVFQRVYAWKSASAFSNLGSLIKVFYQFAREVDDGGTVRPSVLPVVRLTNWPFPSSLQ